MVSWSLKSEGGGEEAVMSYILFSIICCQVIKLPTFV